ncbi:hypothetical protein D3C80_1209170 [compost metagenome]
MEPPEEVIDAPNAGAAGDDLAGLGRQIEAGVFEIVEINAPQRTLATRFARGLGEQFSLGRLSLAAIGGLGQTQSLGPGEGREGLSVQRRQRHRLAALGGEDPGRAARRVAQFGLVDGRRQTGRRRLHRDQGVHGEGRIVRLLEAMLAADGLDGNGGHHQAAADPEQHLEADHQRDPFVDLC